jgi:5-methylcytosine-specific restriction endonuclease McrA
MCNSKAHNSRPGRESVSKRLGRRVSAAIRERDENKCVYCGATAFSSGFALHFDHLTPKSQGGADDATNLVLACHSCNSRRQDMSLSRWAAITPELTFTSRSIRAHARRSLARYLGRAS